MFLSGWIRGGFHIVIHVVFQIPFLIIQLHFVKLNIHILEVGNFHFTLWCFRFKLLENESSSSHSRPQSLQRHLKTVALGTRMSSSEKRIIFLCSNLLPFMFIIPERASWKRKKNVWKSECALFGKAIRLASQYTTDVSVPARAPPFLLEITLRHHYRCVWHGYQYLLADNTVVTLSGMVKCDINQAETSLASSRNLTNQPSSPYVSPINA